MGAHFVEVICLKFSILLDNKVGSISLETLCKGVVTGILCCKVFLGKNFITEGIPGGDSFSSSSRSRGKEEENNLQMLDEHEA